MSDDESDMELAEQETVTLTLAAQIKRSIRSGVLPVTEKKLLLLP